MANLFFTGFAGIDNTTRGELIDASGGLQTGRFGQGMQSNDFMKSFVTADGTVIVGMAIKIPAGLASDRTLVAIAEGATFHVTLTVGVGGVLKAWRGTGGGTLLGTSGTAFPLNNTYHYIELKAKIHDSTGTVDVQFDGANVLTLSGQDTNNAGATGIPSRIYVDNGNWLGAILDDFYINDSIGAAPHNTFYGDVRIDAPATVADGSTVQFTPSAGTNESNIDDGNSPDGDTTYNESSTNGHRDIFTVSGFSTTGTILGVRTRARVRKTDAGARSMRTVVKSGATSSVGASTPLSTSYAEISHLDLVDPNTGVAWLTAGINAAEFGYEISA